MRLAGKTALVTGGARGLGEAIVRALAAEGAAVMFVDLLVAGGEALAADLADQGARVRFRATDITRMDEVRAAVAACEAELGPLTTLVNNAAIALPPTRVTEMAEADFQRVQDVNVTAVWRFCAATFAGMADRGGGSVINLSSVHQSHSLDGWSAYAASKGAIISLTRQLAVEWGAANIRVNSISPGAIDATMTRDIIARDPSGETGRKFRHMHALERLGRPEEVGATAVFLASDGAGFITGTDILVDGGLTKVCRL
jgi:NAD(P)-dependent dehydrogenase (short-subunit alcohol dehydrogenase family)